MPYCVLPCFFLYHLLLLAGYYTCYLPSAFFFVFCTFTLQQTLLHSATENMEGGGRKGRREEDIEPLYSHLPLPFLHTLPHTT